MTKQSFKCEACGKRHYLKGKDLFFPSTMYVFGELFNSITKVGYVCDTERCRLKYKLKEKIDNMVV